MATMFNGQGEFSSGSESLEQDLNQTSQPIQAPASTKPKALPATDIDAKTGKPTDTQIVQWQKQAQEQGMEYKGYAQGEKGTTAIISPRAPKLDPVVEAQKNSEFQAIKQREIQRIDESHRKIQAINQTSAEKAVKNALSTTDLGDPSLPENRDYVRKLAEANSKVASHPFLTKYSSYMRQSFEKGKAFSGQREYDKLKKDFEATARQEMHSLKSIEWERMKFQEARLNLDKQRQDLEMGKENIKNAQSLREYRDEQIKIKNAQTELNRRKVLRDTVLSNTAEPVDRLKAVQQGAPLSKAMAEKIADEMGDVITPEQRKSFIDTAVNNSRFLTKTQDQIIDEFNAPEEGQQGGVSAETIGSKEESRVRTVANEFMDAGFPEEVAAGKASEEVFGSKTPAGMESAKNALALRREQGQPDEEAEIIARTEQAKTEYTGAINRVRADAGNKDALLNTLGIDELALHTWSDTGIKNAIMTGITGLLSEENKYARNKFYAMLKPSSSAKSEETELVETLVNNLKTIRDIDKGTQAHEAAVVRVNTADAVSKKYGQNFSPKRIAVSGDKSDIVLFVPPGTGLNPEDIQTKMNEAKGDPDATKKLKEDLGQDSDGLYGSKLGLDRDKWQKFSRTSYAKLPDEVKAAVQTEEGLTSAKEFHFSDDKFQRDIIDKGIGTGDFKSVIQSKVENTLAFDESVMQRGMYSLEDSARMAGAKEKAEKFYLQNFGSESRLNKILSSMPVINKKLLGPERREERTEYFLGLLDRKDTDVETMLPEASPFVDLKTKKDVGDFASPKEITSLEQLANLEGNDTWYSKVVKTIREKPALRRLFASGGKETMMAAVVLAADENERQDQKNYIQKMGELDRFINYEVPELKEVGASKYTLPEIIEALPDIQSKESPERYAEILAITRDSIAEFRNQTHATVRDAAASLYRVKRNGGTAIFNEDSQLNMQEALTAQRILKNYLKVIEGGLDVVKAEKFIKGQTWSQKDTIWMQKDKVKTVGKPIRETVPFVAPIQDAAAFLGERL